MKSVYLMALAGLLCLSGCSRSSDDGDGLGAKWQQFKSKWGDDDRAMAYGDDEFMPLYEDDLGMQLADSAIPQPKDIPGAHGSGIPSLDQFKLALGDVAKVFQNVYFNTDDYVLRKPEYVQVIDRIAAYLQKHPNTYVAVGGHCDERGSESYNLALGTRRSNYVRSLLVQRGADPNRIHSISYGKEQPVDMGHTPSAWTHNRRVEFKIHEK